MHMELRKNGTDEPICRAGRDTDTENGLVDTAEEEEGGANWESGMKYIHYDA